MKVDKIQFPTRPHIDTVFTVFILKKFGSKKYNNIENAKIVFSPTPLKEDNVLILDMEGGLIDHHGDDITLTDLILKDLNIDKNPEFQRIRKFIERDEKGKGVISDDELDKMFGLSGILVSLNKAHKDNLGYVVELILPILNGIYEEEYKRYVFLPKLVEKLKKNKKISFFKVKQKNKNLKVTILESDDSSIVGYLRSALGGRNDVVAVIHSSGHLNIITRPTKRPSLKKLSQVIRQSEMIVRGKEDFEDLDLSVGEKVDEVPNWYYDLKTNSLLNGSFSALNTEPSAIPKHKIRDLLEIGLSF